MSELQEKIKKQKESLLKELEELKAEKEKAEEILFKEHGFKTAEELNAEIDRLSDQQRKLRNLIWDEDLDLDSIVRNIEWIQKAIKDVENVNIDLRSEAGKLAFEFRKKINDLQRGKSEKANEEINHTLLLFGISALDYPYKWSHEKPEGKDPYVEREFWYTSSFNCERGYKLRMDEFDELVLDQTVGPKKLTEEE